MPCKCAARASKTKVVLRDADTGEEIVSGDKQQDDVPKDANKPTPAIKKRAQLHKRFASMSGIPTKELYYNLRRR